MDYHEINQVVTLSAAAVLDVVSVLIPKCISPKTSDAVVDLTSALFLIPVSNDNLSNLLSAGKAFLS